MSSRHHPPRRHSTHNTIAALVRDLITPRLFSHKRTVVVESQPKRMPQQNTYLLRTTIGERTLILNANSIAGKTAEFANPVDYTKPDAIILTETKLGAGNHFSSEFMPPGYSTPKRKDRKSGGRGVLICVRDCYSTSEVKVPDTTILRGCYKRLLYMVGFLRPPATISGWTTFPTGYCNSEFQDGVQDGRHILCRKTCCQKDTKCSETRSMTILDVSKRKLGTYISN